jgi:hypothetical protein
MRKHCWIVIVVLIGCMVSFTSCERIPKMMEPLLPDAEPEVVEPEPPEMVETPVEPVEEMMEPEPPAMVETPAEPTVEPEMPVVTAGTVRTGLPIVSIDPAEIVSPSVGEQFTVRINITGGRNVAGYNIHVSFDPTALNYISSANADYLPAGAFPSPVDVIENSFTIAAVNLRVAASDSDGTLATVTFEVVEAKASTIGLRSVVLADPAANALENTTINGMVAAP